MNVQENEKKITVQGIGCPVPAVIESDHVGSQPSKSSNHNATTMGNLVVVADKVTRNTEVSLETPKPLKAKTLEINSDSSLNKRDNVFKVSSPKRIAPSKKAYRERRTAFRHFDRINKIPVEKRSVKEMESIVWATKVIEKVSKRTLSENPSKKQKSRDESPINTNLKKVKTKEEVSVKKNYIEIAKNDLIVAVIDKNTEDGTISADNWEKVEVGLASVFMQVLKENPGPTPSCRDGGWFQGRVKLTTCADARSLDLYKIALSKIKDLWKGAMLEVVSKENIPYQTISKTWIPAEPSDPKLVMEMIKVSNPDLPTDNWKIEKIGDPHDDTI